jgi:predicted RNA-binding Zn-ribbon protein involved in translation (DUF1610 family)
MPSPIVRCPYCVLGNEFRPMVRSRKFICVSCGHSMLPGGPTSRCGCPKCQEMNQIASRCRSVFKNAQHRVHPSEYGK